MRARRRRCFHRPLAPRRHRTRVRSTDRPTDRRAQPPGAPPMGGFPLSRAPPSPRRPPLSLDRTRAHASPPHASRRTRASPSPARHRRPVESSRRSSTARAGSVTAPRVPRIAHTASVHTAIWLKTMVNTCDGALKNMVCDRTHGSPSPRATAFERGVGHSDSRTFGQSDERPIDDGSTVGP